MTVREFAKPAAILLFTLVQALMLALDKNTLGRGAGSGPGAIPGQVVRLFAARPLHSGQPQERRTDARVAAIEGDILAEPLRLGLSAFPMLGFLGTVVGLSGAIKALPEAIGNPEKLEPVLVELHVAFDTTLLGLVGALVCLLGARLIEQAADTLTRHADTG